MSRYYPCIYYDRQDGQLIGRCKYYSKDGVQSWCTEGAEDCEHETPSNADRIRAMSDEELANLLYNGVDAEYCSNDPACAALLDTPEGVPEQKCIGCLMKWLKQPAEE